jgi:hypothetical protein
LCPLFALHEFNLSEGSHGVFFSSLGSFPRTGCINGYGLKRVTFG